MAGRNVNEDNVVPFYWMGNRQFYWFKWDSWNSARTGSNSGNSVEKELSAGGRQLSAGFSLKCH